MSAETKIPSGAGGAFAGRRSDTIELRFRMVNDTLFDKSSLERQEQYSLHAR